MKLKAIRNMVTISKYDKKVWENYVSNFNKSILIPQSESLVITKQNNDKFVFKKNKSSNRTKFLKKTKLDPSISLDLHGHTLYSAKLLIHKFISNCYEKNIRDILIITGKGKNNKGTLKEEVPKWLSEKFFDKYLVNFNTAPRHFGGEGALLVRIKNRFKKI